MPKDWWKTFFDKDYIDERQEAGIFKHTRQEVNFLEKIIPLRKSDEILDLCCGHGRHSIELARRGYKVTGLDYSNYELGIARAEAKRKGLSIDFRRGDARNFKLRKKFDVVINMFTSFGYGSREDDWKIIQNVSRALKRGGKFFIELQSLPRLWRNFQPIRRQKLGPWRIINENRYDFLEQIVYSKRTSLKGKQKRISYTQVRNYTLAELKILLAEENLKITKFFGSYRGESFGFEQRRMLIVVKKI